MAFCCRSLRRLSCACDGVSFQLAAMLYLYGLGEFGPRFPLMNGERFPSAPCLSAEFPFEMAVLFDPCRADSVPRAVFVTGVNLMRLHGLVNLAVHNLFVFRGYGVHALICGGHVCGIKKPRGLARGKGLKDE